MAYGFTYTLPTIAGTHTDFQVVLKLADFPSESINGGATAFANGGGDIKAYTSSAKTTQLAIHVVRFVSSATVPSAEVRVKVPSAYTGATIYLEKDTVQTAQPAVTGTYGRNAAWGGWEVALLLNEASGNGTPGEFVDSTGNGWNAHLTQGGTISGVSTNHPFGGSWLDFTTAHEITIPNSAGMLDGNISITMGYLCDVDVSSYTEGTWGNWGPSSGNYYQMMASGKSQISNGTQTDAITNNPYIPTNTVRHMMMTHSSTQMKTYQNGVQPTQSPITSAVTAGIVGIHNYRVGAYYQTNPDFRADGRIGEAKARKTLVDGNWAATEKGNQLAVGAWGTVGAWTDSGPTALNLTDETESVFTLINDAPINAVNESEFVFALVENILIGKTDETEFVFTVANDTPINAVNETEFVFALINDAPINLTSETDSVFSLVENVAIGLTDETDSAFNVVNDAPIATLDETESVFALVENIPIHAANESEAVLSLVNDAPIGTANETESLFVLLENIPISLTNETESLFALVDSAALGVTNETDSIISLSTNTPLNTLSELDSVLSLTNDTSINLANETESVFSLVETFPINSTNETESVFGLVANIPINSTNEVDSIFALLNDTPIGRAAETESVFSLIEIIPINSTNEVESVFALSAYGALGTANETDSMLALLNDAAINRANETEQAFTLVNDVPVGVSTASDAFYAEIKLEIDAVLAEFGTTYSVRGPGVYSAADLETLPGNARSVLGLVADQQVVQGYGGKVEGSWVATRTLMLSADAAPAPSEEVLVDGKWFPMSKVAPVKPANITVVYLLDVSR